MKLSSVLLSTLLLFTFYSCTQKKQNKDKPTVAVPSVMYVGSYTRTEGHVDGKADGIYIVNIDTANGHLAVQDTVTGIINPSFLAISPDRNNLYAVSELTGQNEEATGFIYSYEILEDDKLKEIDRDPTNALAPAHLAVDQTGSLVFVANYMDGVVMVYERKDDGSLEMRQQLDHTGSGPHPQQEGSHPHMVKPSPDNKYLFVPDKGSDKIWSYRIDHEAKRLERNDPPFVKVADGAGPRHMVFHPSGKYAYVINELNSTISVFSYIPSEGRLLEKQAATTVPIIEKKDNSAADIRVHPGGKLLYGSNRGHNTLANYYINEKNGMLSRFTNTPVQGEFPRNFNIDPTGKYLYVANQNSDNIALFEVNLETRRLEYTGHSLDVKTPVSIIFGK